MLSAKCREMYKNSNAQHISILDMILTITNLRLQLHLPGASELISTMPEAI